MLKLCDHSVLLLTVFFLFCSIAATLTFVATAQSRPGGDDAVAHESSANADEISIDITGDPVKDETPHIVTSDPSVIERGAENSASEEQVAIVGRALDAQDRGRPNAVIKLYESDGTRHTVTTDRDGTFRFEGILKGQRIVLSALEERNETSDLHLQLAGETRVFWRTPDRGTKLKSGTH